LQRSFALHCTMPLLNSDILYISLRIHVVKFMFLSFILLFYLLLFLLQHLVNKDE